MMNNEMTPAPQPIEYFTSVNKQANIKQNAAINNCRTSKPKLSIKNRGISNAPLNIMEQHTIINPVLNEIITTNPKKEIDPLC